MKTHRNVLVGAICIGTMLASAGPVRAAFHAAVITELVASYGGDTTQRYVEIEMTVPFQNFVANSVLAVFDVNGVLQGDFVIPGNVATHGFHVPWIMATRAFQDAHDFAADFTIPAELTFPLCGGMVCWGAPPGAVPRDPSSWDHSVINLNYVDCVAYGMYQGPTTFDFIVRSGVQVSTPLLPDGHSLTRMSDTRDHAEDFVCGDPLTPTNNANETIMLAATVSCAVLPDEECSEPIDCDDGDECTTDAYIGDRCVSTFLAGFEGAQCTLAKLTAPDVCQEDAVDAKLARVMQKKVTKAQTLLDKAASATKVRKVKRFLKKANKQLKVVLKKVKRSAKRRKITEACRVILTGLTTERRELIAGLESLVK